MDERERRGAIPRRAGADSAHRKRPERNAQRPGNSSSGANRRPGKRSSRARRRRRNTAIRWLILIILIIGAIGGFVIWRKYGPSNERADLNQYYELEAENDIAVIVNNEVIRNSASIPCAAALPASSTTSSSVFSVSSSTQKRQKEV